MITETPADTRTVTFDLQMTAEHADFFTGIAKELDRSVGEVVLALACDRYLIARHMNYVPDLPALLRGSGRLAQYIG